ncbi:MAG: UDP-N-acetylmuramoyl-tripeptide--D-alanyl-D-alanine ligase [Ginsengibacter sp.]
MQIAHLYQLYLKNPVITTDTRKIKEGDIFFALKGPNFNGNYFAGQALAAGVAYTVIDEEINVSDDRIIKTADALLTLQQLAKYHREQFNCRQDGNNLPFIAITGSNGKTTTKELVHAVLSPVYKTYTTEGNLNNHIGIPLTLLKIKNDAEMAVIEMGANNAKEIEGYCKYVQPTHGLITNFGRAHLQGFGSIEGVRKAKSELFNYLRDNNGTAFVNADDEFMIKVSQGIKNIISYGTVNGQIKGKILDSSTFLKVGFMGQAGLEIIQTQLVGEYNLPNVLAAVTIGKYFNVPEEKIKAAIENYSPSNSRSQMIIHGSNRIILDAYNANPDSMKAAIENFACMEGNNKIVMLGAMMELGKENKHEHEQIIDIIKKFNWDKVVLVGNDFRDIKNPFINFENSTEAKEWFKAKHFQNVHILIKGSRSMQMEKILE